MDLPTKRKSLLQVVIFSPKNPKSDLEYFIFPVENFENLYASNHTSVLYSHNSTNENENENSFPHQNDEN